MKVRKQKQVKTLTLDLLWPQRVQQRHHLLWDEVRVSTFRVSIFSDIWRKGFCRTPAECVQNQSKPFGLFLSR